MSKSSPRQETPIILAGKKKCGARSVPPTHQGILDLVSHFSSLPFLSLLVAQFRTVSMPLSLPRPSVRPSKMHADGDAPLQPLQTFRSLVCFFVCPLPALRRADSRLQSKSSTIPAPRARRQTSVCVPNLHRCCFGVSDTWPESSVEVVARYVHCLSSSSLLQP